MKITFGRDGDKSNGKKTAGEKMVEKFRYYERRDVSVHFNIGPQKVRQDHFADHAHDPAQQHRGHHDERSDGN